MANRYWVGGTANWDATAGTKWALTSGGAGGQAVPTTADDVFFDAASGAVTVSVNTIIAGCRNLNCTGFTGTLARTTGTLRATGSITLSSAMTLGSTLPVQLEPVGSQTILTAGKVFGNGLTLGSQGATGTITLQDALTGTGDLSVDRGTFTTNNYNVTAASLSSSNSNTRTINLGSSTVTLTSYPQISMSTVTGLTFNAGTSEIIATSTIANNTFINSGGLTFYNYSISGATAGIKGIVGQNTFNNLTVTGPASAGVIEITFAAFQTINGTLSTTGTAGNRRVWFRGLTYGLAQTITINSAPSLTDADFRDIYVIGTAAPISGTRIGDLRGCLGITFDAPKTVYWNLAGAQNWSADGWSDTSTGTPSTDFFPLAQDIATFTNAGSVTGTITLNTAIPYTGTVDMSGRTSAMTLGGSTAYAVYGNWVLGSGVTQSYSGALTFSGRNIQTITSAGKTFSGGVTVDSYGGTVELADALNIGSNTLTVTNGTFDTKNYNLTVNSLSSSNTNVRTINFGSSTVTLSATSALSIVTTNLTFNAGTSSIICPIGVAGVSFNAGSGLSFYDVSFTAGTTSAITHIISGQNTFNNLSVTGTFSAGVRGISFNANQTINGTLTCSGSSAINRIFLRSDTLGAPRTLTVNSLSATDCDFRDITIAGTAAGSSPTRAGDCGGNTGITFPAPKTVYWNLAGTQNWSATGWAPGSGGTPNINNFPLAQDTAVFDNTGSAGTITIDAAWNIGTFDASARTSATTVTVNGASNVYGNWLFGTGITSGSGTGSYSFVKGGTQTITSNGVTFNTNLLPTHPLCNIVLMDALTISSARFLSFGAGTFDAGVYNVTIGSFATGSGTKTLKMGSGTWTLSGTGTVWDMSGGTPILFKGTANIILSDTSTTARTFAGGGLSYNKLTIGGATGTSTLTITGNNQFTELASTKTVAHTIALGTTSQIFGAWTVTGTAGNVVTLTGTGVDHWIAGACTSGIDYLAMGSVGFSANSPAEFYAGANSTGTAAAPVYRTAKPADSTRYWVGGTGNWSDTARWSDSSGGASGSSVPRSHDDVVFDSLSNATAYTATVNAVTGGIRTKALTVAGPASGNVTLAGSALISGIHGNVTLPATGLTRTYTGFIRLSGSTTGLTLTTNGVTLQSTMNVDGVGCQWALGSALDNLNGGFLITNGSFVTNNYNLSVSQFSINSGLASNTRDINLGSSVVTVISSFMLTESDAASEQRRANLTFSAGTSQINITTNSPSFSGNNQTFHNVAFTGTGTGTVLITGTSTINNLSVTGITSAGLKNISITANQTINGTLTLSAGTDATMRTFVRSDTLGTTRTLTCAAFSGTDADFRDITIAGAAAPVSGTRLGDCKGNSGITFPAAKTVWWGAGGGSNWGSNSWSATNGGALDVTQFPLAQDTAVFPSSPTPYPSSGQSITFNASYNIGTIDMSARTSNTMTMATSQNISIYGNWINGTGTTLSGTATLTFAGRGSQTITSAGRTFTQGFTFNAPGGSVTLQDALSLNKADTVVFLLSAGAFDANGYNVTLSATTNGRMSSDGTATRSLAVGSGTWTLAASSIPWSATSSLTVTGTGTISLTSASAKTFAGGGISYSGITLNQGGAGTLTISGDNTFANISNSYSATGATTIALGTTTQRVGNFTASGEAGRVLTVQGTSASSPATLVFTGLGQATPETTNYLTITGVRAYSLVDTWYAGTNSTNNGSLGWIFPNIIASTGNFFLMFS